MILELIFIMLGQSSKHRFITIKDIKSELKLFTIEIYNIYL